MITTPEELRSDSGDFGEDFPDYAWRSIVEDLTAEGTQELLSFIKKIDLSVIWNDSEDFQYNLTFYRYVPETE